MQDFEKLGLFYVGQVYDPARRAVTDELALLPSHHLTTHAVVVGMTGSGKTGLGVGLIEEAAIDGIPSLVIDPKGDLANLCLTFPELRAADLAPWIATDEALRRGITVDELAAAEARKWSEGLAASGQDGARIRRLREAADVVVYTPGSTAGVPVSILRSFTAPAPAIRDDAELLADRVASTATSLLALLHVDADPLRSREHILLSTLLQGAWAEGRDLDLAGLVALVQSPPVARLGAIALDTFYPPRQRFELALALNNLLAAPGFAAWSTGVPLEVGELLRAPSGKPRVAILSIAHLDDAERMFFVTLLLHQVLAWARAQAGTTSLRALLYMDELQGYLPPVANPPSKRPLLTLLKQARAFGLGVVLATQNPVDLDYKALSNAGVWLIGRLQTERDQARVLDGLEGAFATAGRAFDRRRLEATLAGMPGRVFLCHDVREEAPYLFQTRFTLSYLRGPMTRDELRRLPRPDANAASQHTPAPTPAATANPWLPASSGPVSVDWTAGVTVAPAAEPAKPIVPPDVPEWFLPLARPPTAGATTLRYSPRILGAADVRHRDAGAGVDETRRVVVLAPIDDSAAPVRWAASERAAIDTAALTRAPSAAPGVTVGFAALPAAATRARGYAAWGKDLVTWLCDVEHATRLRSARHELVSGPGESEREFRLRLEQADREARDTETERLRKKYAPRIRTLEERVRRAEQAEARESEQATSGKVDAAMSIGATLLGSFIGRRALTRGTVTSAAASARRVGKAYRDSRDVGRAHQTVAALAEQLAAVEAELDGELAALASPTSGAEPLEQVVVRARKSGVTVTLLALAWVPFWLDARGGASPAF